jgi:hypothetical protein
MVDLSGVTDMLVLAIVVLGALFVLWSFMKGNGNDYDDEEEGAFQLDTVPGPEDSETSDEEEEDVTHHNALTGIRNSEMSDEEFIESYTGPMMEDAMESLGSGIDNIRMGMDCYRRRLFEEASNDFHHAVDDIHNGSNRLMEIIGMVEDESSKPAVDAVTRLSQCQHLRDMVIKMEEASDAMVEGNELKAREDAKVMDELEKMADSFN